MDRGDNPRFLLDDWVVRPAGEAEDGDFSSKMLNVLTRGSHGSAAPSGPQGAAVPVVTPGGGGWGADWGGAGKEQPEARGSPGELGPSQGRGSVGHTKVTNGRDRGDWSEKMRDGDSGCGHLRQKLCL